MLDSWWATSMFAGAMICGLGATVAPWYALRFSRWAAATTAGVLLVPGWVMFLISNRYIDSGGSNIRLDILINLFLFLVAWLECAYFAIWAFASDIGPATWKRALWAGLLAFGFPAYVVLFVF